MGSLRFPIVLVIAAIGCAPTPTRPKDATVPTVTMADIPFELADEDDLATVLARYEASRGDDPERKTLRTLLATEYGRRMDQQLRHGKRHEAYESMLDLASLWAPPLRGPTPTRDVDYRGLAEHLPRIHAIRTLYARAGGDREVTAALAIAMAADAAHADAYRREIDAVFNYADDLAVAYFGQGAQRSRTISLLETLVEAFPSRFVVERLASLYAERQQAISRHFKRNGADFALIRAHGDGVLRTTWNIVRIYARANRVAEALPTIQSVVGLGDDPELRSRLRRALAGNATAMEWILLASSFRGGNEAKSDLAAALRICLEAARRFPKATEAYLAAADSARDLDNVPLAISLYERARELHLDAGEHRAVAESLAALYVHRMTNLATRGSIGQARERLTQLEAFHHQARKVWPNRPLSPDLADAYSAMGRGLAGLGELANAETYLTQSLVRHPSYTSLEFLGSLAAKQDRYDDALRFYRQALALPVTDLSARFARARLLRLASEVYLSRNAPGDKQAFARIARDALDEWDRVAAGGQLEDSFQGEMQLERGKILWELGAREGAIATLENAVDVDQAGASTHADVVAFFLLRDQYDRALDTYHRALGSFDMADYYKVYMSLWVLAETRRLARPDPPLLIDYLSQRDGPLWHDYLARYAVGSITLDALQAKATTRGRRAELTYYTAVLNPASTNAVTMATRLREVLDSGMIFFFEYDMAKHWLRKQTTFAPKALGPGQR